MANRSSGRGRTSRTARQAGTPTHHTEPEVRRWPHPIEGTAPSVRQTIPTGPTDLYYIHCALSYQNQLLADIKALVEQLAADSAPAKEENAHESSGPSA